MYGKARRVATASRRQPRRDAASPPTPQRVVAAADANRYQARLNLESFRDFVRKVFAGDASSVVVDIAAAAAANAAQLTMKCRSGTS